MAELSVNLRTVPSGVLLRGVDAIPLGLPSLHAVHFGCGCSEITSDKAVVSRTYCPNGECRRLSR